MPSAREIADARAKAILESERETSSAEKDILIPPESGELGEPEIVAGGEHTPKEWRERLRALVSGARERFGNSEREERSRAEGADKGSAERLTAHLNERSQNLRENAKGLGPKAAEAVFSVVERYNKLNWKTKLTVTGVLMLGVSATAVAMPLVSGALTAALYGQRIVGAVGLGMNKRKALDAKIAANPEHWKAKMLKSELAKNTYAAALAAVYMAGTSLAVHEGVEFLRSLGIGELGERLFGDASDMSDTEGTDKGSAEPPYTETPAETATPPADTPPVATESATEPETVEQSAPDTHETQTPVHEPATLSTETVEGVESADNGDTAHAASEGTPTSPDVKPIEAKPESNLAAKEFGAEYVESKPVPEDLSAQEWNAEYAEGADKGSTEPVNHTGAPEWRAEHTEADFATETPAEAPAPADAAPQAQVAEEAVAPQNAVPADAQEAPAPAEAAPPQPEAGAAPATPVEHLVVNAHGLSIDANHAGAYLDTQGNHIIYGGTLDARAELAKQWVVKDHSAVVFFESTRPWKFLGLFEREVPHLSMAQWVDAGAESGVRIAEDTNDPSLVGIMLPTENDLAQAYKLAN